MKPIPLIALITVLTLVGSFVFNLAFGMVPSKEASAIERLDSQVNDLDMAILELVASNRQLTEIVSRQNLNSSNDHTSMVKEPIIGIEEAVTRWMRNNRPDLLPEDESAVAKSEAKELDEAKLAQASLMLAKLNDPDMDDAGWNEVWKKISEAGLLNEALAVLENNVTKDPNNAEVHLALAGGYFGKSVNTANDMEKGIWAIKADKVLDRALELDPWHWEARSTKAVSLTYYPPAMGKLGEAMKHFEILRDQQKQLPQNAKYAQTYLYLGNLHFQMGNNTKALKIWKEGLNLYPNNAQLAAQLANSGKN